MELDYFLIKERIKQITTSFSKGGWLTIYESTEDDLQTKFSVPKDTEISSDKKLEELMQKYLFT